MIVLDSDILINLLRKEPATVDALKRLWEEGETLATTSLNVAEVLRGANRSHSELATATRILEALEELPLDPRAARRFGRTMHALDRAGNPIPAIDGMVAAVTLEHGGRLMTQNTKHFEPMPGLELLTP